LYHDTRDCETKRASYRKVGSPTTLCEIVCLDVFQRLRHIGDEIFDIFHAQ
jgi:hypothetical protein